MQPDIPNFDWLKKLLADSETYQDDPQRDIVVSELVARRAELARDTELARLAVEKWSPNQKV